MNVLTNMMCNTASLLTPQNYKEALSKNKILNSQDIASKSMHIISPVSQIPTMDESVNHSTIDMYNQNQIHVPSNIHSGFEDNSDVSVFSDSFPEIVPSWLTNDFMKASETLAPSTILSNVPDIYQVSRENEHLQMLDLGFSPELTSQDITSGQLDQACITGAQVELPIQRFQNNNSLLMSTFDEINITDLNSIQYQKFKPNAHLSKSQSLLNPVLSDEHLLLHPNLSEQCLTSTSSPSLITSTQSQLNPVVCDKVPQLNLNNLDSLLGSNGALSHMQLLPQNFPNVGIVQDVNCPHPTQPCLTNYGSTPSGSAFLNQSPASLPLVQDVSVQVSGNSQDDILVRQQQCFSCCRVDSRAAIDIAQCFKCRLCDYVSLHKCAIESHINSSHSKPPNMFANEMQTMDVPPIVSSSDSMGNRKESNMLCSSPPVSSAFLVFVDSSEANTIGSSQNGIASNSEAIKCEKCDKVFSTDVDFKLHSLSHQNVTSNSSLLSNGHSFNDLPISGLHQCIKCDNTFVEASTYIFHLTTEHNMDPKLFFNYQNIALKPTSISSDPRIVPKENVDLQVNTTQNTKKKPSNPLKKLLPKTDNKVVSSSEKVSCHKKALQKKRSDRDLGTYICEYKGCNVRYRVLDNLEFHRKCHASSGPSFACPECGLAHKDWGNIAGHLWRNHKIDMELHACDKCPFRTFRLNRLENIHKKIHNDVCPFLCDVCGKAFKNGKQMRNHRAIHADSSKKEGRQKPIQFKCKVCSQRFPSRVLLHHHQDVVHNLEKKTLMCSYCDYKAFKQSTLTMHMRLHTGEKPFECDQCEYRTSDHNSLRRHKMKHSGEKKYQCPYCPYSSIQSSSIKDHMKKHPGQNGVMFSCKICSYRTLKSDFYEKHMRDHESLNLLQNMSQLSEASATEDMFSIAAAMNFSLSHGDNGLIPHLNKHKAI